MAASEIRIVGETLANIPWEDRPADCAEPIWRYSRNPIIPRDLIPTSNSIFNSAAVSFDGAFAGVFRCDSRARRHELHTGFSDDGVNWRIEHDPIQFDCDDPELAYTRGYDPRVTKIEDRYWVQWCNAYHGPTIGLAWTTDFKTFHQIENALLPFNRNGVLFPRKIGGEYVLLSRPSDAAHTAFGDIFLSRSKDMVYWGRHRHVMARGHASWASTKIGAGPVPIETSEGWLLIYHGVLTSCNGYVYAYSSALLDLDEPWKVIARAEPYLMAPWTQYECVGDVPNVAFPCAALCDAATGRLAIYYGAADTVTALAFAYVGELVEWTKANDVALKAE